MFNNLKDKLENWRYPKGFVQDDIDPRDVYTHELMSGDEEIEIPKSFSIRDLGYRYQGKYPFCVAMATEKIARYVFQSDEMSQQHLFFLGGGGASGSSFKRIFDTALNIGLVPYEEMPMPANVTKLADNWVSKGNFKAAGVPTEDAKKIPGYARVLGSREQLKHDLVKYGPLLIGVYAGGTYYNDLPSRYKNTNNHAVVLTGWDENDNWEINDSLGYVMSSDGYRFLGKDYDIVGAMAVTYLPDDWRQQRDEARKEQHAPFEHCLNHYGKPRRLFGLTGEQGVAEEMQKEFKKFNNQSVMEAAGLFWTIYINAVTYGGYTYTDVINDCYQWRRTGEHIFDFNKTRAEWEKG